MGQSTNDIFPTAISVSGYIGLSKGLAALDALIEALERKAAEFDDVLKIGRTHLQDATPITLGQEIGGWAAQVRIAVGVLRAAHPLLLEVAAGGTAVGTGLNCHPDFAVAFAAELARVTGFPFKTAPNKFAALAGCEAVVAAHAAIKGVGAALLKVANDVRWLASGPRCGLGEITIPANEPGSSIMPGKVNPTQCEALIMCVQRIFGNDVTVSMAGSGGNFELNVSQPVIADALLQSIRLLTDSVDSFTKWCVVGIAPCRERLARTVGESLMLVTALAPVLGYDRAARIATHADRTGTTLKQAAVELGELTAEEFDAHVVPAEMIHPK